MKIVLAFLGFMMIASPVFADEYVNGYYRRDGGYVQPHHRTTPDSNTFNNYSTQGNVNPYSGQGGTVDPYAQQQRQNKRNNY